MHIILVHSQKQPLSTYKVIFLTTKCTKYNSLYKLQLSHCLTTSTLRTYIKKERINSSLIKKGLKASLPSSFLKLLQFHVSMKHCQERESVNQRRWRESLGLPLQTPNWGKNSQQICPPEIDAKFPSSVQLPKAMKMEDWWSMWMVNPNNNLWFDSLKWALLQHGYAKDKLQLVKEIFIGH